MNCKAVFRQIGNDLYWEFNSIIETKKGYEFFSRTWVGSDDANWWDNIASLEQIRTVTGSKGTVKTFKINFLTCEIEEVKK